LALLLAVLSVMSFASCGEEDAVADGNYAKSAEKTNYVCIELDSGKQIVVELYPEIAPITVANFQKLVGSGFYDGLTFHRIMKGFMIQGGDPEGTGFGGPGWEIKGEFAANGVKNDLKHTRGVLSMARSNDPDSAGSQFFIMHKDSPHLDGNYAAFGKVVSGMDVVDELAGVACNGDAPVDPPVMKKVYFVTPENGAQTKAETKKEEPKKDAQVSDVTSEGVTYKASEKETDLVCIRISDEKAIVVELYPEIAPLTVANFKKLVGSGFYDGLTFHRIMKGFMIQGGDPAGNGTGGPGWTIKGEFAANGVQNDLKHTRGILSMARKTAPDTAGSQFFIVHQDSPHLDGSYAAFGKVIVGMNVVDELAETKCSGETPVVKPVMEKVYFVSAEN